MKILVTGASGQDGVLLIKHILHSDPEVKIIALSRNEKKFYLNLFYAGGAELVSNFMNSGIFITCDITDRRQITQQLGDIHPNAIFHLAAHVEPLLTKSNESQVLQKNLIGLINIVEACEHLKIFPHIINAGSSLMFGAVETLSANELTPFRPLSAYGIGKVAAHQFALCFRTYKEQKISTAILFNHESILRDERWLPAKIIAASVRIKRGEQDRLHLGDIEASRDWSAAKDIVTGLYAILEKRAVNRDFVLGFGDTMKVSEVLDIAFKRIGLDWKNYTDVQESLCRGNDVLGFSADITRAKRELNWKPSQSALEWVSEIQDFHLEKTERK